MTHSVTAFWSDLRTKLTGPWTLEKGKEAAEELLEKYIDEMDRRPEPTQVRRDGIIKFLTDLGQQPTVGFDSVPEIELQKHVETLADAYREHWRRKSLE